MSVSISAAFNYAPPGERLSAPDRDIGLKVIKKVIVKIGPATGKAHY